MTKDKRTIYLAAPLFTQAEWQWNALLAQKLEEREFLVILPQRRSEPMLTGEIIFNALALFDGNRTDLERADIILAIFDQPDPDSGTCWECGYAYKLGKPIIGLRSDIRRSSDGPEAGINLMLASGCTKYIEVPMKERKDVSWIVDVVVKAIGSLSS